MRDQKWTRFRNHFELLLTTTICGGMYDEHVLAPLFDAQSSHRMEMKISIFGKKKSQKKKNTHTLFQHPFCPGMLPQRDIPTTRPSRS